MQASCHGVDTWLILVDEEAEGLCLGTRFGFDMADDIETAAGINCHSKTEIECKETPQGITVTLI